MVLRDQRPPHCPVSTPALMAQVSEEETPEQAKDFMVLLQELRPRITGRSRWYKVLVFGSSARLLGIARTIHLGQALHTHIFLSAAVVSPKAFHFAIESAPDFGRAIGMVSYAFCTESRQSLVLAQGVCMFMPLALLRVMVFSVLKL